MIGLEKVLKAIEDLNRLRIINLLPNKTLCNENISSALKIEQTNLSKHLIKLVEAGILDYKRNGRKKHYSLSKKLTVEYKNIYKDLQSTFKKESIFITDSANFVKNGECSCTDIANCNCKTDIEQL